LSGERMRRGGSVSHGDACRDAGRVQGKLSGFESRGGEFDGDVVREAVSFFGKVDEIVIHVAASVFVVEDGDGVIAVGKVFESDGGLVGSDADDFGGLHDLGAVPREAFGFVVEAEEDLSIVVSETVDDDGEGALRAGLGHSVLHSRRRDGGDESAGSD
jgi:hypothetical protein